MSAKTFAIIFLVAYSAIALPTILLLGPPGFSSGYLEEYREETDHYFEVVKNPAYKLYKSRPNVAKNDPLIWTQDFQGDVEFVLKYETRHEFEEEMHRREIFELVFEFLNWFAVTALIGFFAHKPLLKFLDDKIVELREKLDTSEKSRDEANAALASAESKIANLDAEEASIEQDGKEQAERLAAEMNEQTQSMLSGLKADAELRKKLVAQQAAMQLKREIVERAIEQVEQTLLATRSEERQRLMIKQFMEGLAGASGGALR